MKLATRLRAAAVISLTVAGVAAPAPAVGAAAPGRPPALPDSGSGPAAFAYLCVNPKDRDAIPSGPCDTWRLVTADGQIFSVPEALGWDKGKDPDALGEPGSFAI